MNNQVADDLFATKLALLQEIIDKKRAALQAILAICENQEQIYLAPPSETKREFLIEMGKEKQKQIDEIITCDAVFQRVFDEVGADFEEKSKPYAEQARKLQSDIKEVLELDVKIRAQEQKNMPLVRPNTGAERLQKESQINTTSVNYILEQYKNNKKP